ncbi:MAG: PEP-CTERM sorting domain-containing protein [Sphingomonadales bacterium]|nr:PEP-CTERM sorting domain-containing protein [Sphingomonadales bacterium]
MRKIFIAAAAAALLPAAPAYAATTIVPQDNSSPGPTLVFTSGNATATFGATYSVDDTSFVDSFFFTLAQAANLTGGQLLTSAGGSSAPFKADLDISLVNLASGASTLFSFAKSSTPSGTDKTEQFDIPAANLNQLFAAGTYSFNVMGFADNVSASAAGNGAGPGSYSGSLTFAAAPVAQSVPEPSTWAMMLLGFGVIGVTMRSAKRPIMVRVRYA